MRMLTYIMFCEINECFYYVLVTWVFGGTGLISAMWLEIGRMLSWSSMTTQFLQDASERMNLRRVNRIINALPKNFHQVKLDKSPTMHLSLNLPTTS